MQRNNVNKGTGILTTEEIQYLLGRIDLPVETEAGCNDCGASLYRTTSRSGHIVWPDGEVDTKDLCASCRSSRSREKSCDGK